MKNKIIIGTRGSKLALWQSEWVKTELKKLYPDLQIELNKIKTTGDKILDVPLAKIGGKGLFIKEIEEALLSKKVDIAVHSMKDIPVDLQDGLHLMAICKRENPQDAFISQIQDSRFKIQYFQDLQEGSTIGTSSLRRCCQLLHIRRDLNIVPLRGNLDTRLKKLDEGNFDAIILAVSGMKRLGLEYRITEILPKEICLPAAGQGAIGIECRIDDIYINEIVGQLNHLETSRCLTAEREFLKRLGGGCQVPIAANAIIVNNKNDIANTEFEHIINLFPSVILKGLVGSIDGKVIIKDIDFDSLDKVNIVGKRLAERMLLKGAKEILDEIYKKD